MTLVHAFILSVVEGISEFLPISSTGHLILASHILGLPEDAFAKSFDIVIQFGAILAIVSLYWNTVRKKPAILLPVFAAFLPTAVIGLSLYHVIKTVLLGNAFVTVLSLIIGGFILLAVDRFTTRGTRRELVSMPVKHAVIIGLGQSLAVIPGVSRSAATIVTALLLGYSRASAVEFSFLLAVPTIGAAAGLDALKNYQALMTNLPVLFVGFLGSWITAIIAVRGFVGYMKRHSLMVFGWYRIVVGCLFWTIVGV